MRKYEVMLILPPDADDNVVATVTDRIGQVISGGGGRVVNVDQWGRRRLAYEIDHKNEAYYHLLHVDCEPPTLDELTRVLKITDGAMRHMAVRRAATQRAVRPGPPPERVGDQTPVATTE